MTTNEQVVPDTLFHREGKHFVPTTRTRGPWDPGAMTGGATAGLLMYEVERLHLDPPFQVSRVTTDMFRRAPIAPLTVRTEVAREGGRIRVVDAFVAADGVDVARASVVMLRRSGPPEGALWSPPAWEVPHPDTLPATTAPVRPDGRPPIWERRTVGADADGRPPPGVVQRRVWMRNVVAFVDGAPASALVRAAIVSDTASPLANGGDRGLNYINADASLYLHRDPVGEWIGVEVVAHHAADGIAVGDCALYDLEGPFGRATACALANERRP